MEKLLLRKKIIRVFTLLLVVAALVFLPPVMAGSRRAEVSLPPVAATLFAVRTEYAEVRTLQAYIEVNANIVSSHQVAVLPDVGGLLTSMRVNLGDEVQAGQLLAQVDPSRPGAVFSISSVHAPVSGMVITNPATTGSTVTPATPLLTLALDGSIEIEAFIPEREVGQLRPGLGAEVRLEAFPGETFHATLTQLSPVVDPLSRTKRVILTFNNNTHQQRVSPGMFARIRLNTCTHQNVVSVPQEAVIEHRGRTVVYVLHTNESSIYANDVLPAMPSGIPFVEMREVSVGVNVNREVEITSGLQPGEAVVVQGKQFLTDGTPVRVLGRTI
ncbi:MAG: efflux RND transporter periplasmic adaptor subunit [Treponema sp.]|nr:efflux RND transporter periplasmic adaptor subunit [Treponema sp.]